MNTQLNDTTIQNLVDILSASPIPLSTRDLGVRLRFRHFRVADHNISGLLRKMLKEGHLEFQGGRWSKKDIQTTPYLRPQVAPLPLSDETIKILGTELCPQHGGDLSGGPKGPLTTQEANKTIDLSGRWGIFRKLVSYYRQCIRNEEGADASAFQNENGKRFIYLRKVGPWLPRPGASWRTTIPLSSFWSPLLNSIPATKDDQTLVIGYPVQAFFKEKEDEPDVAVIRPIFFIYVDHLISRDGLVVSCEDPRPEVNLSWLEYAFSRNHERQRSFLSACGFINRWRPNDETPGIERGEIVPSMDNLVAALAAFIPERVRQPLRSESISDDPLAEPFESGIYSRAVLMLAKRTKYTVTLLRELSAIEKANDSVLDKTALRHIFAISNDKRQEETREPIHESLVSETIPLNAEQRLGIAALPVAASKCIKTAGIKMYGFFEG
jgi:hypothetical protein